MLRMHHLLEMLRVINDYHEHQQYAVDHYAVIRDTGIYEE